MATRRKEPLEISLNSVDIDGEEGGFYASGIGVHWPDNPVKGRFRITGLVVGGMKSMLYRRVEILMTLAEAKELRDSLDRWIQEYPNTGMDVEVHTGGSHF